MGAGRRKMEVTIGPIISLGIIKLIDSFYGKINKRADISFSESE